MTELINEWDNASTEWVKSLEINTLRTNVLIPETLKMLGEISGKRVLDLGCGEGGYSRIFARKGAKVVGVDYSKELINEAMKQNQMNDIEYYVANACFLKDIEDDSFDFVVSAMCLMAIDDLAAAVREAYRVMKSGGEFVISILHPCFGFVEYYKEGPYEEILSQHFGKPITFYHRTLSNTINCMLEAGFNLVAINEPMLENNGRMIPKILLLKLSKKSCETGT